MNIHARYDRKVDRMLLTFNTQDAVNWTLWVTRRHWLGLLHATGVLLQASVEGVTPLLPQPKKKPVAQANSASPVHVQGIRLQRMPKGTKIVFVTGDESVIISMDDLGLQQLKQMMLQQAERANWDVSAALARLKMEDIARSAMRQANCSGRLH
jgi:hypothetical protein